MVMIYYKTEISVVIGNLLYCFYHKLYSSAFPYSCIQCNVCRSCIQSTAAVSVMLLVAVINVMLTSAVNIFILDVKSVKY